MAKRKNLAAVALGRRRAKMYSPEELSEQATASAATRFKGTTANQRSAMMTELVRKRWGKKASA